MKMKRMYGAVAQGDSIRQKETPVRPWEQPEARNGASHKNGAQEQAAGNLSGLEWLRDLYLRWTKGEEKE
jgi:hypothetical protein